MDKAIVYLTLPREELLAQLAMELIYTYLGNGIQHDLCLRFVESGYDLEIIWEEERKQ